MFWLASLALFIQKSQLRLVSAIVGPLIPLRAACLSCDLPPQVGLVNSSFSITILNVSESLERRQTLPTLSSPDDMIPPTPTDAPSAIPAPMAAAGAHANAFNFQRDVVIMNKVTPGQT